MNMKTKTALTNQLPKMNVLKRQSTWKCKAVKKTKTNKKPWNHGFCFKTLYLSYFRSKNKLWSAGLPMLSVLVHWAHTAASRLFDRRQCTRSHTAKEKRRNFRPNLCIRYHWCWREKLFLSKTDIKSAGHLKQKSLILG